MNTMPSLQTALLDILHAVREDDMKIIVGGGFGIYLKREYTKDKGPRTLLRQWPQARSTIDLDLFLRP